jgi:glutamyl-tRNA synthetase
MDALIKSFSIERVGKSGSKFDIDKAKWINHQYLMTKKDSELAELFMPELIQKGIQADFNYVVQVCNILKNRVNFPKEFWEHGHYFFIPPQTFDKNIIKKRWKANSAKIMKALADEFEKLINFDILSIENCFQIFIMKNGFNNSDVLAPLRLVLTGLAQGPSVFEIMDVLGKEETVRRMRNTELIHSQVE